MGLTGRLSVASSSASMKEPVNSSSSGATAEGASRSRTQQRKSRRAVGAKGAFEVDQRDLSIFHATPEKSNHLVLNSRRISAPFTKVV